MYEPNWMIHYIQEHDCACCGKHEPRAKHMGFDMFANAHTQGFKNNGHDEICIVLDIGPTLIMTLLNNIGFRIREKHEVFKEGINSSILEGMNVTFYRSNDSNTLYMLLPDPNGLLPGDENCQHPYNKQIIYADIIEQDRNNEVN